MAEQGLVNRLSEYSLSSQHTAVPPPTSKVVDRKTELNNRRRLYGLLFSRWTTVLAIFPAMFLGVVPVANTVVIGEFLKVHTFYAIEHDVEASMIRTRNLALTLVAVAASSFFVRILYCVCWVRIGSHFCRDLRVRMFRSLLHSETGFFDECEIGGILTLVSEDSENVQEAFGNTKATQLSQLSQFLGGLVALFILNWRLALIALASVPISCALVALFSYKIDYHVLLKFKYTALSMTIADEALGAMRTVAAYVREVKETDRFREETLKARHEEQMLGMYVVSMFTIVMNIFNVFILGILYYGGTMVQSGMMAAGSLFSTFGLLIGSQFSLIDLQTSLQAEQRAIGSGGRILDIAEREPKLPFEGGRRLENFRGDIEFQRVWFKYPTRDVFVLRDVSWKASAGEMIALVGHSGSGKSTCVQLIERFYDVSDGRILIDGVDIRDLDPRWLHRQMALVAQEPVLFRMTVEDNVRYGNQNATREEITHACHVAHALKFISKMENGFKTMVGEKGSTLSGGQRQRVAIARAVICDPKILLCDEATSALDAKSERVVQLALDHVLEGRTGVIVAHRLSTIRRANRIYVFDAGEIHEQGTHDELISHQGMYFDLVRRQLHESVGKAVLDARAGRAVGADLASLQAEAMALGVVDVVEELSPLRPGMIGDAPAKRKQRKSRPKKANTARAKVKRPAPATGEVGQVEEREPARPATQRVRPLSPSGAAPQNRTVKKRPRRPASARAPARKGAGELMLEDEAL